MKGFIYKTTCLVDSKIYIGQTTRISNKYLGSGRLLVEAIKEHGKENFKKEIIFNCNSKKQMSVFEQYFIRKLKSQDPNIGYNITKGGEMSPVWSKQLRKQLSDSLKKFFKTKEGIRLKKKNSEFWEKFYKSERGIEVRKQYSEYGKTLIGDKNPNFGNKWPEKKKKKLRKIKKIQNSGTKNPMFGRLRITDGKINKTISAGSKLPSGFKYGMSEITKAKKKLDNFGENNPMWNKVRITNGIENRMIEKGKKLPEGFWFGLSHREEFYENRKNRDRKKK